MIKSLKAQNSTLSDTRNQLHILEGDESADAFRLVPFQQKLEEVGLFPLKPVHTQIFQVNIGKMCNQVCKHCHVDAGPDRKGNYDAGNNAAMHRSTKAKSCVANC